MALYFYQAYSREGKKTSGYIDAASLQAAKEQLSRKNIYPTKIELAQGAAVPIPWYRQIFTRRIGLKEKIFFTKQLGVLLRAGVPLVQALDLLVEQTDGRLRDIVITLRDNIKEGQSLAEGLQRFPRIFDAIFVQLIRAGEATGRLEVILERLTEFLEKTEDIKKRIRGALRYPLIQLGLITLVTIGMLVFVVPQITTAFATQNIQLPLPTRILITISDFLTGYYIFIGIFLALLFIGYRFFKNTSHGAYLIDRLKLKLPLVGYFSRTGAIVQFCRTLGMLIEGGVNLSEALNIVVKIVDNKVLAVKLEEAKENIIKQGKISQYLKETGLFPPVAIYLINTGEQSGQLGQMLIAVAKYYEDELTETTDTLTSLLNPIMLVVMASIVGFIILSIMAPIQSLMSSVDKMSQGLQ